HLLGSSFLLINGDSWFDTNLARLFAAQFVAAHPVGCMLLRHMDDCSRYGTVTLASQRVVSFNGKDKSHGPGIISCGIYFFSNRVVDYLSPKCSLEEDVLPQLVDRGSL